MPQGIQIVLGGPYDPVVGRFVTEDSYAGRKGDPQSLNRYVYAEDNPERNTNRSGHYVGMTITLAPASRWHRSVS
jgi:hypothetical protein